MIPPRPPLRVLMRRRVAVIRPEIGGLCRSRNVGAAHYVGRMIERRLFRYVGPADLMRLVQPDGGGVPVRSSAEFDEWVSMRTAEELAEPFTFVVDAAGLLRLA